MRGKTVVVTGGARGIGRSAAEAFAKEGCNIAVCDINDDALAEANAAFAAQNVGIHTGKADMCDAAQVGRFAEEVGKAFGRLDVWVNNAGIFYAKPILEMTLDEWRKVIRINMDSVFLGTQAAAREMIKTGGGCIVNTSSYAGIMPTAHKIAYGASKAGVIAMTKETASELAPHNIRVNCIAPGMVMTDMMAGRLEGRAYEELLDRVALRRLGKPEDIANMCVFLASDAAQYITGATYEVTGGMFCVQDVWLPWNKEKTRP